MFLHFVVAFIIIIFFVIIILQFFWNEITRFSKNLLLQFNDTLKIKIMQFVMILNLQLIILAFEFMWNFIEVIKLDMNFARVEIISHCICKYVSHTNFI